MNGTMKTAIVLAGALAALSAWIAAATSAPMPVPASGAASGPASGAVSAPASGPTSTAAAKVKLTPGEWLTNYDEAVRQAKASKLPILADFTGSDWCGWCMKLKAEVFDKPEFKAWAARNVVLLELDFPSRKPQDAATKAQNKRLAAKYSIEGYPTILFLRADGEVIGRSGYRPGGPAAWIADANETLKKP